MPPPVWAKEPNDRKTVKNAQNRNNNAFSRKSFDIGDQLVGDLMGEIQEVVAENAQLQSTNKNLKDNVTDLKEKYDSLMEALEGNKSKFEEDLNKLQDEIKHNEMQLIENSRMCLLQQKKHVQEINSLRAENEKLQIEIARKDTDFMEKMKNLEGEVKVLQAKYDNVNKLNDDNAQKSARYKSKLKYAITIINDLNNMLVHYSTKPDCCHQETQTNNSPSKVLNIASTTQSLHSTQSIALSQHPPHLETEHLLLSEVFFKSKAFCDNEIFLLNETERDPTYEDFQRTKLDL